MITTKNKNNIPGLNQFPVRNGHWTLSKKYYETVNSCIKMHCSILLMGWICPRLPNNAIGFLHFHWLRVSYFSQRQGFNQLVVFFSFLQDLGIFLSQYFIPISLDCKSFASLLMFTAKFLPYN